MKDLRFFIGANGYGAGNIGDDAVLLGIIRALQGFYRDARFTVSSHGQIPLPYLPPGLDYVDAKKENELHAAVIAADVVCSGGGTMIGDELSLAFPLGVNHALMSTAKKNNKKTCMISIGANRLRTIPGIELAQKVINAADFISVRDSQSKEVCEGLAKGKSIFSAADPAYSLQAESSSRSREVKRLVSSMGDNIIGVNVVNESWSDRQDYKQCIAMALECFCREFDFFPVFFQTEVREGYFYDYKANEETASYLNHQAHILIPDYFEPEEMLDIMTAFDFVLSMRMHGLIFAAVLGIPHTSIARVDKVNNFMNLFSRQAPGDMGNLSWQALLADMKENYSGKTLFKKKMKAVVNRQKKRFAESFYHLDEFLNRSNLKK